MNKKRISLIVFIIGIITLLAGVVFLIIRLVTAPKVNDGDFLVSAGEWSKEDDSNVIWNFNEIGKGTLTTNNHLNDYDFKWTLEDGKLKIKTEWLYEMDDEFDYKLDQNGNTLIVVKEDEEIKFTPTSN